MARASSGSSTWPITPSSMSAIGWLVSSVFSASRAMPAASCRSASMYCVTPSELLVVVHVHDPGVRCDALSDLVGVVGGRQSGADVEELPDPAVCGQVRHRPAQERARVTG